MHNIQLKDIFYVDKEYSLKHPHMIHRHEDVLELLYIAEECGRYIVGNYEYAVTEGDFIICNSNVPHGEDPFQEHKIQTYCLVLSGANLEIADNERPIISLGKKNPFGELLPKIYTMFLDILPTPKVGGFRYHQLMPQKNEVLQSLLRWTMPRPVLLQFFFQIVGGFYPYSTSMKILHKNFLLASFFCALYPHI